MNFDFDALLAASSTDEPCRYRETDAILYSLGVGFGQDSADYRERDYVYEGRALRTVPSMAANLLARDFLDSHGWDGRHLFVVEQKLELYRPLPARAELQADRRVVAAIDHGEEQGVSIMTESEVRMTKDGTVLFTLSNTLVSNAVNVPNSSGPLPHILPERDADLSCELHCGRNLPLIFRLGGDRSAVYADNAAARALGFEVSPVQEQCVAGIACRAILSTICEFDFTLVSGFDLRFTAPVYPGDEITTEMWQERNIVSFRCLVKDRGVVVVDNGKCTLAV
ncbi:MAG: MaoC/PaaZ C-terminal domain-containing protein [Woeseia sp.]